MPKKFLMKKFCWISAVWLPIHIFLFEYLIEVKYVWHNFPPDLIIS